MNRRDCGKSRKERKTAHEARLSRGLLIVAQDGTTARRLVPYGGRIRKDKRKSTWPREEICSIGSSSTFTQA